MSVKFREPSSIVQPSFQALGSRSRWQGGTSGNNTLHCTALCTALHWIALPGCSTGPIYHNRPTHINVDQRCRCNKSFHCTALPLHLSRTLPYQDYWHLISDMFTPYCSIFPLSHLLHAKHNESLRLGNTPSTIQFAIKSGRQEISLIGFSANVQFWLQV